MRYANGAMSVVRSANLQRRMLFSKLVPVVVVVVELLLSLSVSNRLDNDSGIRHCIVRFTIVSTTATSASGFVVRLPKLTIPENGASEVELSRITRDTLVVVASPTLRSTSTLQTLPAPPSSLGTFCAMSNCKGCSFAAAASRTVPFAGTVEIAIVPPEASMTELFPYRSKTCIAPACAAENGDSGNRICVIIMPSTATGRNGVVT